MGCIFVLLGKTYSYKEYIKKHASTTPSLYCTDINNIDVNCINVVTAGVSNYMDILCKYKIDVYPVYVDTPDGQILADALLAVRNGEDTCEDVCKRFLDECKEYSGDIINGMKAEIIRDDNASDACKSFISYAIAILSNHN